jgi:uncharacterized protein involved in exopolysaccharide biosynthesis
LTPLCRLRRDRQRANWIIAAAFVLLIGIGAAFGVLAP